MTDQLTGVSNRRRHDHYSMVKWQEAARLQVPFSICMFDIDKFKVYNDTFGHPAGDRVIAAVAQTASEHLRRSTDFFARYGGVTVMPRVESSYDTYLKIADTMLYDAKRFGRNQVVWSDGRTNHWREKNI